MAATILSGFSTLADGEAVVLQWLIFPAVPRPPACTEPGKLDDAIFNAVVRLGAVGDHQQPLIRAVATGLSMTYNSGKPEAAQSTGRASSWE